MKLWTYQSADFSLFDGKYDPAKSEWYRRNSRYAAAYRCLWDRVGNGNLVWCSTSEIHWPKRREWVLEVPVTRLLKVVDSMVWNGILGNDDVTPPGNLRDTLLYEAMQIAPADLYGWYDTRVNELQHPAGDPWDSLFLSDPNDPKADILLEHPLERSWVVSTKLC